MAIRSKHIVVTGGGSGVGCEIAKQFVQAGGRVTIMGRRESVLQKASSEHGMSYQVCDVTDVVAVETAFKNARVNHGAIDIVVANAGNAESKAFSLMEAADLNSMLDVNVIGTFNVWKAALEDMKSSNWGRMISIASTAGLKGYPYVSGYCAAKHSAIGLTRALAVELASSGITVNAVCPGFVDTPLLERSITNIVDKTNMSYAEAEASLKSVNPQKRFIQPEEVAEAVLWLCSDGAKSVNGHTLSVSGGEI